MKFRHVHCDKRQCQASFDMAFVCYVGGALYLGPAGFARRPFREIQLTVINTTVDKKVSVLIP